MVAINELLKKIPITKKLKQLIADKVSDFIVDFLNNRINDASTSKNTGKATISVDDFEKRFRQELGTMDIEMHNSEAVVFQARKLFEYAILSFDSSLHAETVQTTNIFGGVQITINLGDDFFDNQASKRDNIKKDIYTLVEESSANLFEIHENGTEVVVTEVVKEKLSPKFPKRPKSIRGYIANDDERIKKMWEQE